MTAATMTRDPDLDQAIERFRFPAQRLRQLEAQFAAMKPDNYRHLTAMTVERGEIWADLKSVAEQLNMVPGDAKAGGRALLLIVEEAWRLRNRNKRKPTPVMVEAAVRAAIDIAERDRTEAAADRVLAEYAERLAERRLASGDGALKYMEASKP